MFLNKILQEKHISVYKCAKDSNIPYTTMLELVRGKTKIEKCSAQTVYSLSKVLQIPMETLIESCIIPDRVTFETFKSQICHAVKEKGDIDFIVDILKSDEINKYWELQWYPEAFYLLAMLDYLSRENDIPLCNKYNSIRTHSLKEPLFPRDVVMAQRINDVLDIREQCMEQAIPEFMRFNIVEQEVRNVV